MEQMPIPFDQARTANVVETQYGYLIASNI